MRVCLLIVVCAAVITAAASARSATARAAIGPSFARLDLNALRTQAGLPPVRRFSGKLNRGCRLHNRYMAATGEFGHSERRGSRFYTAGGARAAQRSVIAMPQSLPSAAWGDSVYHRIAMLQPRLRRAGFSANSGFTCLQVLSGVSRSRRARSPQPTIFSWPPNGSQGHAPMFAGGEYPDPFDDAPGAGELGTPITFNVNGPWRHWPLVRSNVTTASIVSDLGEPVPVSVSDMSAANAAYLQGGFALLPRQSLAPNTWYTATASGSLNYFSRSWSFNTSTRFRTGDEAL